MSLREIFGRFFESDTRDGPVRTGVIRPAERAPAVRYVDHLLADLFGRKPPSLTLKQSEPPPAVAQTGQNQDVDVPPFIDVANRLKFLAGLNPMTYPEPVDGRFEWKYKLQAVVVQVHFEDRASDPFCTVRLS